MLFSISVNRITCKAALNFLQQMLKDMSHKRSHKKDDVIFEGILITVICIIAIIFSIAYLTFNDTSILIRIIFRMLIVISISLIIVIIICLKYIKPHKNEETKDNPQTDSCRTQREKEFLSPAEKEFKTYLHQNLPTNIEIHCKVRLADILKQETKSRRIIMMHVDYLLLDQKKQEPILVIELDDKSHNTPKAKERDSIKNDALKKSGISYFRVPNYKKHDPNIIQKIVDLCNNKTQR